MEKETLEEQREVCHFVLDLINEFGLYQYPVSKSNFYTPLEETIADLGIDPRIGISFLYSENVLQGNKVNHFAQLYGLLIPIQFLEADGVTGFCETIEQVIVSFRGVLFLQEFFTYIGLIGKIQYPTKHN